jgi:hypothetical protein
MGSLSTFDVSEPLDNTPHLEASWNYTQADHWQMHTCRVRIEAVKQPHVLAELSLMSPVDTSFLGKSLASPSSASSQNAEPVPAAAQSIAVRP